LLHLDPVFVKGESRTLNARRVRVLAGGRDLGPIVRTYGEVSTGDALVMVGSEGLLEIAVNQGHAARALALGLGDVVEIVVA